MKSLIVLLIAAMLSATANAATSRLVYPGDDGKLKYTADENGNTIPDFSNSGYMSGGVRLPDAPIKATLEPTGDAAADDTARIQAAIDQVSKLPFDEAGHRGAVLLKRGKYRIETKLRIAASGVVLRGEGDDEAGTILIAAGTKRRDLIEVKGSSQPKEIETTRQTITDDYVPVGARTFTLANSAGFSVGDEVFVHRTGNEAWIHFIGMNRILERPGRPGNTKQWKPFELVFDRIITAVEGNKVTVDAPIVCAIEQRWGGGTMAKYDDRRIEHVGVENLRADSEYDKSITGEQNGVVYPADEDHASYLVSFDKVKNAWARNLTAVHFSQGVSAIREHAKWVTVQDCISIEPVSTITGGRRYPFLINGQLNLVQRCTSNQARHAFALGSRVCGPNVFLECKSTNDYATSEPHHRWSVGGLFDNVHGDLAIQDRQYLGTGHGWAGANYVAWNCEGTLVCQQPPTAQNWAIGFVGTKAKPAFEGKPQGHWEWYGTHVEPRSLYLAQLKDRLNKRVRTVSSATEIEAALQDARAGDELVMTDGDWNDEAINFSARGTAEKPITLRAQTPGKVVLKGDSRIVIDGEHLVVSGLLFGDSVSTKDAIQIGGVENRVTDCAIIAPKRGGKWIHFMAGARRCRLDHCYLEGHEPQDVRLQVEVDEHAPNEHRIDRNHFGPRPPLGKNGGETIRVGYSFQSFRNSRTLVEHNLFERCDGEIEIISSKSCENVYRYNTFRNSEGCLTLRHGDRCVVDSNFFFGNGAGGKETGGIRVIGNDHTITNNYFDSLSGLAGGVIVLTAGIPDSPLTGYWQIKKALIARNTFVNNACPCIVLDAGLGDNGRTLLPENVTIESNLMVPPAHNAKPLIAGKQGKNLRWAGNRAQRGAQTGSAGASGVEFVDVRLKRGEDGVWRAAEDRAAGARQSAGRPLTAADVGPSWLKRD